MTVGTIQAPCVGETSARSLARRGWIAGGTRSAATVVGWANIGRYTRSVGACCKTVASIACTRADSNGRVGAGAVRATASVVGQAGVIDWRASRSVVTSAHTGVERAAASVIGCTLVGCNTVDGVN